MGLFSKPNDTPYEIKMFQFRIIFHIYSKFFRCSCHNNEFFYRSNNRSSVNGVKVNITVAISLVFILVLVSVLIVCYVRNQYGFKGKVQQCITGMNSWDVFCTVVVFTELKSVVFFLLNYILEFLFNLLFMSFLNMIFWHFWSGKIYLFLKCRRKFFFIINF